MKVKARFLFLYMSIFQQKPQKSSANFDDLPTTSDGFRKLKSVKTSRVLIPAPVPLLACSKKRQQILSKHKKNPRNWVTWKYFQKVWCMPLQRSKTQCLQQKGWVIFLKFNFLMINLSFLHFYIAPSILTTCSSWLWCSKAILNNIDARIIRLQVVVDEQ